MGETETIERFDCFGSRCAVLVRGDCERRSAREAAQQARRSLLEWHARFSRFLPDSELSRLNRDPRESVPVSPLLARLAASASLAASATGGLVDGTLLHQIEAAGYAGELGERLPLEQALEIAPPRAPGRPDERMRWRELDVDVERCIVRRPAGLKLDSGGLAKGLFADLLAARLAGHDSFAVDCGGDLVVGGRARLPRAIEVQSPFDGRTLHIFHRAATGAATSGIGARAWRTADGGPAHHLLDPASGQPVFSGVSQATALAPSALLAEAYAKAAVLSGPHRARHWLRRHGGVLVLDDGTHVIVEQASAPGPRPTPSRPAPRARMEAA